MKARETQLGSINPLVRISLDHPGVIKAGMTVLTLVIVLLALLPSIWPQQFSILQPISIDTDPENMLAKHEPVRVLHNAMKKEFALNDMLVVGVVSDQHPQGVFNRETLARIYALTEFARTLTWPSPDNSRRRTGVIDIDVIAPSNVDNIEQGGPGTVNFSWLMPEPPRTEALALKVRQRAKRIPFLDGTLLSEDGKAIALYLPITDKDSSFQVREQLLDKIQSFGQIGETYHITGLPVAEDTFGVEMFYQMAISAPLAMLVIFVLLWWFFKKPNFIMPPMIVAVVCALSTMGLLIISGKTIHIMSSMIPIFIMPIAVLDSVHILSEFFDRYRETGNRKETLVRVMKTLFVPMLFTTLTTAVGFASLALTPIPPVQVFGVFIAIGVLLAWFWTVTFIPAFIMTLPNRTLDALNISSRQKLDNGWLDRLLRATGAGACRHAKLVLLLAITAAIVAIYGITLIKVNDNPVRWFNESHPIRVADRVLNNHFGGTYMAYLELEPSAKAPVSEAFKQPNVLRYLSELQDYRVNLEHVGKVNSLADIVKTVHRELFSSDPAQFRIPDSREAVAQTLLTFQSGHRPHDLWHFVTPSYDKTSLWLQLKSGDNRDMKQVEQAVADYMATNPPPLGLTTNWFGLTHINMVWQQKMVNGMVKALLGSFTVVLLMLIILFRSLIWGLLAVIPLGVTVGLIYGIIGLVGKDYDMPIAVLSSLSLGLAIDYAIHFIVRSRMAFEEHGSWRQAVTKVFAEPARAITRNAIIVGVGFLPLLAAPLMPYQTVGLFIAAILLAAGVTTLWVLPALITVFEPWLFPRAKDDRFLPASESIGD